nr:hypothetical protein BaRGS_004605 [Batillaria attramentaria]
MDNKDNYYSMDRARDGPYRIRDAPQGRRTFHTFGPQYNQNQQPHPAWQRAKGLDGGWRSVTPTTSYATDDDDLTTTSGSYTLSPDDPPTDGDDLPFHQVHDIMV